MTSKYEYKTIEIMPNASLFSIKIDKTFLDDLLNKYGNEGWELITSTPLSINSTTRVIYYTFRRAI